MFRYKMGMRTGRGILMTFVVMPAAAAMFMFMFMLMLVIVGMFMRVTVTMVMSVTVIVLMRMVVIWHSISLLSAPLCQPDRLARHSS